MGLHTAPRFAWVSVLVVSRGPVLLCGGIGLPRHLAIGDIHGCFNALRTLCDYVQLEDDDCAPLHAAGHLVWTGPDADRMHDSRVRFITEHAKNAT